MKTIRLKPVMPNAKIINLLEKRNLIRTLKPAKRLLNIGRKPGAMQTIYTSCGEFGSHKLVGISLNSAKIKLNSHPDNEEFIIINSTRHKFRPLYIVVGLYKHELLETKALKGNLNNGDFIVLRLKYNDPKICVFTMLKNTPHCELTLPGKGRAPIFFVAEPSKLKMRRLKLKGYNFTFRSCL
jgi:hypothetical protein